MSKTHFGCSRRTLLAAAGALAVLPALSPSADAAAASSAEEGAIAAVLEALRVAILAGDSKALGTLLHKEVVYAHSDGHLVQTKAEFIAMFGGKISYKSLVYSDASIKVVGNNAIVRHTWDGADIMPDGSIGHSYIKVMQVWRKEGRGWTLFARQSCPIKS